MPPSDSLKIKGHLSVRLNRHVPTSCCCGGHPPPASSTPVPPPPASSTPVPPPHASSTPVPPHTVYIPFANIPTPAAFIAPSLSVPYSNVPLSTPQVLHLLQESTDWVGELCKKQLFEGLGIQVLNESELPSKVKSLLALAYETRDLHIAQLFALERKHRRDALALEMQKFTLLDARAKISADYTELDDVKLVLINRGFGEEVHQYAKDRDAPNGCNVPPSDVAFVYKPFGGQLPCQSCTDEAFKHNLVPINQIAPPV